MGDAHGGGNGDQHYGRRSLDLVDQDGNPVNVVDWLRAHERFDAAMYREMNAKLDAIASSQTTMAERIEPVAKVYEGATIGANILRGLLGVLIGVGTIIGMLYAAFKILKL